MDARFQSIVDSLCLRLEALGVIEGDPLTDHHEVAFADRVPEFLMALWQRFGFAGFSDGRFWLTDPLRWQPAADAWTAPLDLAMGTDERIPIRRSAFGP